MRVYSPLWLAAAAVVCASCASSKPRPRGPAGEDMPPARGILARFEYRQPQMGLPFRIVLYAADQVRADAAAAAAFKRIEQLNGIMSDYDEDSELSRLSRTSGQGKEIPVSDD